MLASHPYLHSCHQRICTKFSSVHPSLNRAAPAAALIRTRKCTAQVSYTSFETHKEPGAAASTKIKSQDKPRAACRCQAANSQMLEMQSMSSQRWDVITARCVELSTVAFVFLLMPQVVKNYISMAKGNNEALAVLSWVVSFMQYRPTSGLCLSQRQLCCVPGILDLVFRERFAFGLFRRQGRGRCNSSPSNWCNCKLCHAWTGRCTLNVINEQSLDRHNVPFSC